MKKIILALLVILCVGTVSFADRDYRHERFTPHYGVRSPSGLVTPNWYVPYNPYYRPYYTPYYVPYRPYYYDPYIQFRFYWR